MNSQNPQQIKAWYEKQKNGQWKTLTEHLCKDPKLHSQLNNFIKVIYQKFRQQKNLPKDFKPTIKFKGFSGFQDFEISTKMGHCDSQLNWKTSNGQKVAGSELGSLSIVLSQKLLLSKLGMEELITDYFENARGANWTSLPVSFKGLIGTVAHEIAHAYQFLVNEDEVKSQCESTGERDSEGKLKYPQLASEHTALTEEIQTMTVKLAEYQKFKNWWEGKEGVENLLEDKQEKQEKTEVAEQVSETSAKTSRTSKSETKKLEQPSNKDQNWPDWVLPVGIIGGIVLVGGILYWIFKKK